MTGKTKHLGARLPVEVWDALKKEADKRDLTLSQLLRRIARQWLRENSNSIDEFEQVEI